MRPRSGARVRPCRGGPTRGAKRTPPWAGPLDLTEPIGVGIGVLRRLHLCCHLQAERLLLGAVRRLTIGCVGWVIYQKRCRAACASADRCSARVSTVEPPSGQETMLLSTK